MSNPLRYAVRMKNKLFLPLLRQSRMSAGPSSTPALLAECVAPAPAALPEEYWFPTRRPRRMNPWNRLAITRNLQPQDA